LKVDPGCNALELCCGVGAQTKYFAQKIKQGNLDCIDINPESIEKAKASIDNEKVNFIVSEIDDAEQHIDKKYDIIFCAYGFYYSKSPEQTHTTLKSQLKKKGRFVIVGPTCGNNFPLFEIVKNIGCKIPDAVIDSSEKFMLRFLEIFLQNYNEVKMHRVINKIAYSSHDQLLEYWKNTTFYFPGKEEEFLAASKEIFPENITIDKSIAYLEGVL
jgi:ubiquinone/menaquinone biosynthesis C-methylase UbiE